MGDPAEVARQNFAESNTWNLEICQSDGQLQVSEESVTYSGEKKQSLRARYVYGFIFFMTNVLAWFIRDYGQTIFHRLHYIKICGEMGEGCSHTRGVLRVSLGCLIFFSFMFLTTFRARRMYEVRSSWHSSWWFVKSILYIMSLMVPFGIPEAFIPIYGQIARIGAGFFLLLQLISVIHFITWCNDNWMSDLPSKHWDIVGLFFATIAYVASFLGIVLMYIMYAPAVSCTYNIFFITWTAILVKAMMVVSLHSKINRGLLSSGIMGSYIVFLCWSAMQSEPPLEKCKTPKRIADNGDWTTVLGFLVAIFSIVMATFSTGIDSQSFQFQKSDLQTEDEIPYKYDIFHFIFSMGAMYFAMLFISWELDHPTRKWTIDDGWASTWVKISNEWFAASFFLWKLISPAIRNQTTAHRVPAQQAPPSV